MKSKTNKFKLMLSMITTAALATTLGFSCTQTTTEKEEPKNNQDNNNDNQNKDKNPPSTTDDSSKQDPNTQLKPTDPADDENKDKNSPSEQNDQSSNTGNTEKKEPEVNHFEVLETLPKDFAIKHTYTDHDAAAALEKIKNIPQENIVSLIGIEQKYRENLLLRFKINPNTNALQEQGIIENIELIFSKDNKTVSKLVNVFGFVKRVTETTRDEEAYNFVNQKEMREDFKKLYPSLLAMTILNAFNPDDFINRKRYSDDLIPESEDANKNEEIKEKNKNRKVYIDLDSISTKTANTDYFKKGLPLSAGLKSALFEYSNEKNPKYDFKIAGAAPDDLNGNLILKLEIFEDTDTSDRGPVTNKTVTFSGMKSLKDNLKNENEFIKFTLKDEEANSVINRPLKTQINSSIEHLEENQETEISNSITIDERLKETLFKKLFVSIKDSEEGVYKTTSNEIRLYSLASLDDRYSVFPFVTFLTNSVVENVRVFATKKNNQTELKLKIDFSMSITQSQHPSLMKDIDFGSKKLEWTQDIVFSYTK
ncbi:LppA-related lipoprotein [Mycoplasma procyoni]|uniref:LppA-related lipoprotein n=1 Tax=Mycoplasma procyoni TaxID=568784 RepID=UPI00197C5540|nr:hypothetical protein [Mycoplasma procyoni]MBN3534909.1 hypothetical protein [Mycoplasma procyoni]